MSSGFTHINVAKAEAELRVKPKLIASNFKGRMGRLSFINAYCILVILLLLPIVNVIAVFWSFRVNYLRARDIGLSVTQTLLLAGVYALGLGSLFLGEYLILTGFYSIKISLLAPLIGLFFASLIGVYLAFMPGDIGVNSAGAVAGRGSKIGLFFIVPLTLALIGFSILVSHYYLD